MQVRLIERLLLTFISLLIFVKYIFKNVSRHYPFRLSIDNLEKEVNALKSSLTSAEKSLENAPDDVKEQLSTFLTESSAECEDLQNQIADTRKLISEMALYFCEDPKKFPLDEYLGMFKQFSEKLTKAKDVSDLVFFPCLDFFLMRIYQVRINVLIRKAYSSQKRSQNYQTIFDCEFLFHQICQQVLIVEKTKYRTGIVLY